MVVRTIECACFGCTNTLTIGATDDNSVILEAGWSIQNGRAYCPVCPHDGLPPKRGVALDLPDPLFESAPAFLAEAERLRIAKNHDYGDSWRRMRPESLTDQIMTKVERIIQLEKLRSAGQQSQVAEGIHAELIDILNYTLMRLTHEPVPSAPPARSLPPQR